MAQMTAAEFLRAMQPNPIGGRGDAALKALAQFAGYGGDSLSAASRAALNDSVQGLASGKYSSNAENGSGNYAPDLYGSLTYNQDLLNALAGYTFTPTSDAERSGYSITAPDGRSQVINWGDKASSFDKFAEKAIPLAIGAMGAGAAFGAFGGAGGIGSSVAGAGGEAAANLAAYGASLTPAQAAAGVGGLDLGAAGVAGGLGAPAGAGFTAGGLGAGGITGAGITAPTLAQGAGLGAGLGTVGAAGGAAGGAATGSFWGGLAKAAIPAAISTGAQLIAGNQAAKAQQSATNASNDLQRYVYDTTRADNMPALQARNSALQQMQALLSDPSSLTKQPGYQFGMDQGTKTLQNGAAARGMTYSGAQGKALQRFGQDYAGSKLDQSFNRLSALASSGQTGAGTIANAAGNYGNQVGNNLTAMGDANAARYIVGGNAIGNAVNGLTAYGQRQGWWGG